MDEPLDQETLDAALLLINDRVVREKVLEHQSYASVGSTVVCYSLPVRDSSRPLRQRRVETGAPLFDRSKMKARCVGDGLDVLRRL